MIDERAARKLSQQAVLGLPAQFDVAKAMKLSSLVNDVSQSVVRQLNFESPVIRAIQQIGTQLAGYEALKSVTQGLATTLPAAYAAGAVAEASLFAAKYPQQLSGAVGRANFESAQLLALGGVQPWAEDIRKIVGRSALPAGMADLFKLQGARLSALELGYAQRLGGPSDAFGRLDAAVRSSARLADAVDELMNATRTPGGLGFDRRRVEGALDRVDDVLTDPEVERVVVEPMEEVLELTGLQEDVIQLPDIIGMLRRARDFRVSTRGIFCGLTVGSLYFVSHAAYGTPLPTAGMEAFVVGADIYVITRTRPTGATE